MTMRLVVCSHKPCWRSSRSASGYATDGGFPFQMQALSELFDATTLVVPCADDGDRPGEIPLCGRDLAVVPLAEPGGHGFRRKLAMVPWFAANARHLWREIRRGDAVHAPIPGDVGTLGMLLAWTLRKPLFVRHCGNWLNPRTTAEHFWKWFMERFAGGRNVMLATGGNGAPPSAVNPALRWIYSTSLSRDELAAVGVVRSLPVDRCRLIIVSRQEKPKGTGVVLESLAMLREHAMNVTLDVVGDGRDRQAFERQTATLGLSDCVRFHGRVNHDEVMRLLHDADLFCYPTTASEGFPKVVLEALASGLPVVTTRVSVLPELMSNRCGILIDEPTPDAMCAAIRALLADPERYREMSARAIDTAGRYSLEGWSRSIGELLQNAWGPLNARDAARAPKPVRVG